MTTIYRQGDVLLVKIDKLPEKLEAKDNVVAYGEVTGHRHRLTQASVFKNAEGEQFAEVMEGGQIVHEEHADMDIQAGAYEVRIQRELTPQEVRRVMD